MTVAQEADRDIPPLLVTAHFDEASFEIFDGLRRRHFPGHLNRVPAHLSLFHKLPGHQEKAIVVAIAGRCRDLAPFDLQPSGLRFLGRGVALAYQSSQLSRLHGDLATAWQPWLTPQDRQPFKAHITIQNKVEPATARALFASLQGVEPPPCRIDGVTVWRYLDGPWRHLQTCYFGAGQGGEV